MTLKDDRLEQYRLRIEELERSLSEEIGHRDEAIDAADKLAYAIAPEEEIGEHSSANNPWRRALDVLEQIKADAQRYEKLKRCRATIRHTTNNSGVGVEDADSYYFCATLDEAVDKLPGAEEPSNA